MADQSNPWDTAAPADNAAQSADAWGNPTPRPLTAAAPTGLIARLRRSQNISILWIRSIKR